MWYCEDINKWGETDSFPTGSSYSTHHHGPKTTKAFLRYLNKHPELKGVEVVFVHHCYYDSVEGKISLNIAAKWVESMLDAGYQKPLSYQEIMDSAESLKTWK